MAITADTQGKHDTAAPPSYAAVVAQSGPSSASQQPRPVTRTYSLPGDEQSHLNRPARSQDPHRQYHGSAGNAEAQWFPPTSDREVRSRTRKRFLIAFLWAFAIYTLLGLFIGGTVEDARERGRHHRHSGQQTPQRPIDDAPSRDPHAHPTRTWHKITPTPTILDATDSIQGQWQVEQEDHESLSQGSLVSEIDE